MNPSARLGPRLNAIFKLVEKNQLNDPYTRIWDCCCDHGYLGIKILSEHLCEKLIFVDQLPHIMAQLSAKIEPFSTGKHELITANAGDLCFDNESKHLVILAGIGGETSVEILESIRSNHLNTHIDYIFCPSASHNDLRNYLASNDFGLIDELLVNENRRYYQILYIKGRNDNNFLPSISATCELWDKDNADHQKYLNKINSPRLSKKPKRKMLKLE